MMPPLVPVHGLPEGLHAIAFRAPEDGERLWDGELRHVRATGWNTTQPHLIVELLPGYDEMYDVCQDRWVVSKTPPPFPRPEAGDWLDFAGELLASQVQVERHFVPDLVQYPPREIDSSHSTKRATSGALCFADPTREQVAARIRQAVEEMALQLNLEAGPIGTGELPVPQAVAEKRMEVRRGVAMRYVRGRDAQWGWVVRLDVLYRPLTDAEISALKKPNQKEPNA